MGFYKIRNDCTKNDMKNKKRQYKGGKMTTRQTFTAFLINDNECSIFIRLILESAYILGRLLLS